MAERFHRFKRWAEEYGRGATRPQKYDPSHRPIDTGTRPRARPLRQVQVLRRCSGAALTWAVGPLESNVR